MYFEPQTCDGAICRDGGLRENNPIQLALNEARDIWGSNTTFDAILSLGSGYADKPQPEPWTLGEHWLQELFKTLFATMNGNAAWEKFKDSASKDLLERVNRLNIRFPDTTEPDLDDVKRIKWMEELASTYELHEQASLGDFAPVSGNISSSTVEVLTARFKAALYFFDLKSITQQEGVAVIKGWICCRILPNEASFEQLVKNTRHFNVKGKEFSIPCFRQGEYFRLEVLFQHQISQDTEPIRIDVKFNRRPYASRHQSSEDITYGHDFLASISGFPITLKVRLTIKPQYITSTK